MNKNLDKIAKKFDKNGIILTKDISKAGFHRSVLNDLVNSGKYEKVSRGIYNKIDEWEDEFYTYQLRYKLGIYSHETALYLYEYTDKLPYTAHMTFPQGYNCQSLKKEPIRITRVNKKYYELGITEIKTPAGSIVKVYNLERCLCDIVRGRGQDLQTIQYAMRKYMESKDRDINKLIEYAKKLRVLSKIRNYIEILM